MPKTRGYAAKQMEVDQDTPVSLPEQCANEAAASAAAGEEEEANSPTREDQTADGGAQDATPSPGIQPTQEDAVHDEDPKGDTRLPEQTEQKDPAAQPPPEQENTNAAISGGTQPKKRKERDGGTAGVGEDGESDLPLPKQVASTCYWLGLAREAAVSVQCVKKVHKAIRKVASRDLVDADIGKFTLHGIAKFVVRDVKFRAAYTASIKGKKYNVSERAPYKKIQVTSQIGVKGLSE